MKGHQVRGKFSRFQNREGSKKGILGLLTPPSPPKAPLRVVSTIADTVTLRWGAPEDDGGSPVTGYALCKRDLATKLWEDVEKIPEFVTEYTVAHLKENTKYLFRVSAVNEIGESEHIQTKEPVYIKRLHGEIERRFNPLIKIQSFYYNVR